MIVANDNGVISQWFEVLNDNKREFTLIRDFKAPGHVTSIVPEFFRKGFLTTTKAGDLSIFHSTGETELLTESILNGLISVAISPRANAIIVADKDVIKLYMLITSIRKLLGLLYGKKFGMKVTLSRNMFGSQPLQVMILKRK